MRSVRVPRKITLKNYSRKAASELHTGITERKLLSEQRFGKRIDSKGREVKR